MTTTNIVIAVLIVILVGFYFSNSMKQKEFAKINEALAAQFLEKNRTEEGVIETASGLQYQVLVQGDGDAVPSSSSKVTVHYHGTLVDGTVFDSSVDRGASISFKLNQVIPGWTEGVQLMQVGDKYRFWIKPELAYGNRGAGKIGPGSLLIFDVELLGVE